MESLAFKVREANKDTDAETLAEFMTLQALETENKIIDQNQVLRGVIGLFDRPECGKYYSAIEVESQEIIGMMMIHFEINASLGGFIHWVNSVYVKPAYRKHGVFKQLFLHVEAIAKQDPLVKCIRLYVDLDNQIAQRVYRKVGMSNIEDDYDFYERDLHFPSQ